MWKPLRTYLDSIIVRYKISQHDKGPDLSRQIESQPDIQSER